MKPNKEIAQKQRQIFSDNLNYYLKIRGKNQSDIVEDLGVTSSTVSDWANARKYPRVDKMQALADYLGVLMSDLREEKPIKKDELSIEKEEFFNMLMNMNDQDFEAVQKIVKSVLEGFGKPLP